MFLRSNLAGILWALFILLLSGVPNEEVPEPNFLDLSFLDKLVHLFFYSVLAFLLAHGYMRQYRFRILQLHAKKWSFITAFLYGGLIEAMQYGVFPDRSFELGDALANGIGAGVGIGIFRAILGKELS